MATTKIWAVRDSLKRLVDYAGNPEKTEYKDLSDVIHYANDKNKTEKFFFVSGINCTPDKAYQQMVSVKAHFGKLGGNLAYHGYQSFRPGEVTPDQCHEIGLRLAEELWSDRFQVLVATHLDKNHLHNHVLINSVSFVDGKKFNDNKRAYYKMREVSDRLCKEYSLSVIENPKGKTPRSIYFAEKNGEPTKYNLMREAIDKAIIHSNNFTQFAKVLHSLGYEYEHLPNRKYATIKAIDAKKATRLYHLGEDYDVAGIHRRLMEKERYIGHSPFYLYRQDMASAWQNRTTFKVSAKQRSKRKIGGLKGLYFHYCYLLGILPKGTSRKPLSPQMKEACRRLEQTSQQIRLICKYDFSDLGSVEEFVTKTNEQITVIAHERNKIYNKLRRCTDPEEISELKMKRNSCTSELTSLRNEKKIAERIIADNPKIREEIVKEQQMNALRLELIQKNDRKRGHAR